MGISLSKDPSSESQSAGIAITHIDTRFLTEASYSTNGQGRPDVWEAYVSKPNKQDINEPLFKSIQVTATSLILCVCVCVYTCICIYVYMGLYIYIYIWMHTWYFSITC